MQNWKVYSRDASGNINSFSYAVGSSFDFFIIDTYGEARLKDFFTDMGQSKDLSRTIQQVFGISSEALEGNWKAYLTKH